MAVRFQRYLVRIADRRNVTLACNKGLVKSFPPEGSCWRRCYNKSNEGFGDLNDFWNITRSNFKKSYEIVKPGNVSPTRGVPGNIEIPAYEKQKFRLSDRRSVKIKTANEIEKMRMAGLLARKIMNIAVDSVKVGTTTDEIDKIVHDAIIAHNAYPSPLFYCGFPKSVCTSVNNVACHGIPDDRALCDGDIITIDVTVFCEGFHGDCAETIPIGSVDSNGIKLIESARKCRDAAVEKCHPGQDFSVIGKTISSLSDTLGFKVVPSFCGHGIDSYFHGPPDIFHFANNLPGKMKEGMTFTIEPVISEGSDKVIILEDGWTAVTTDHSRTAQFEHTILITDDGAEILTKY